MNADSSMLKILQSNYLCKIHPKASDLLLFRKATWMFYNPTDIYEFISMRDIGTRKFINYIVKQAKMSPECRDAHMKKCSVDEFVEYKKSGSMIMDQITAWKDYLNMCHKIGQKTDDEYYLLPPDLRKAHDRVLNIILERKEAERKAMNELCQTVLSEMNESPIRKMHTKSLIVRIPRNAQDLKDEGIHNHNCVGTYVDKVARRETLILFIRKAEDPDTTYYTMEYCNGQLVQCRGMHNETAKGEVMAFAKAITRKLNDISNEQQKKKCGINTDMSRLKAAI